MAAIPVRLSPDMADNPAGQDDLPGWVVLYES